MGLMSAMYDGISGLNVHSQAMSVVGNNLANASTVGFKASTMQFEDMFYANVTTGNSIGQVGLGASIASIYGDFSQGAFQTTSSATDLAISGNGFFMVRNSNSDSVYYTRAGNFTFNTDGYLVDPNGYVVQGWQANTDSSGNVSNIGALGDIKLDSYTLAPQATSKVRMITNLSKSSSDNTTDATDPYFALFKSWAGQSDTPLADTSYAYQSTIKVYDQAGASHTLTVYYDKVSNSSGQNVWEYTVTCNPSEDGRVINGVSMNTTSAAGILVTGTISFNAAGTMSKMSAFTISSNATGDMKSLSNWVPATFSTDGYPNFTANFAGVSNGNTTLGAGAVNIKLDLGMHSTTTNGGWTSSITSAADVGTTMANLPYMTNSKIDSTTTTSYSNSSSILDQSQNGYAAGYLQSIAVDSDGVVTGTYSNNQTKNLFVVGLADFTNLQGLHREGSNLYSKTPESGEPRIGTAGNAGMGSISSGTLEQSNVDTATQMVNLITYQRGFQSNSKVITTVDSMLSEVIQLKR